MSWPIRNLLEHGLIYTLCTMSASWPKLQYSNPIDRLSVSNFSHIDSLAAKVSRRAAVQTQTNKHAIYVYGYKTISTPRNQL